MVIKPLHILLADDDRDDCELFQEALKETSVPAILTAINDGVQLMQWLQEQKTNLPDLLFLDLNMPPTNGLECLIVIKEQAAFQALPVIMVSQTVSPRMVDALYEKGALYFLQKSVSFQQQITLIEKLLRMPDENKWIQPPKKDFMITGEKS